MPDGVPYQALIGPVARQLLGEPNKQLSSRDEMRFGSRGSLVVRLHGQAAGTWFDHEANRGGGVLDLVQWKLDLDKAAAVEWLNGPQKAQPEKRQQSHGGGARLGKLVAAYDYISADGELLFQVTRHDPKDFRQRRPDGKGGWLWGVKGVELVPYRLPELLAAPTDVPVFIVEGEKDVDRLRGLGLVATCNPGGAGKWRASFARWLKGRHIIILPDNDQAGRDHAAAVAQTAGAQSVRIIDLPDLPPKGDVSDWVTAGGTTEALMKLADAAARAAPAETPSQQPTSGEPTLLTEHGVAMAFTERFRDQLRYCHDTGAWFQWTGTHWQRDRKHAAFSFAREVTADANRDADMKAKAITGRAAFSGGVERFAQRDPAHAVTSEAWDADPYLLATPGGVVDLRTGRMRHAKPADMMTRITAVGPDRQGGPPARWLHFLDEATGHDAALATFLQRWCGYCLTGDTKEHALLFGYGPGGNGKSVFLNTVARIMGDYAVVAAMDTFTASLGDKHPTDLAMLRGARLVTATETEEGRAWAESRIKQMTGGDPITARFMRQDFFTFTPQFKLTLVGNHKPVLKNVDDAAKRRFNIVPFLHQPATPDRELESKLRDEWPAILAWMIEGCMAWQAEGLTRPAAVQAATDEYFEVQDHFGRWLAECCILDDTLFTKPTHLLSSFQQWCRENGEPDSDNRRLRGMIERTPGLRYAKVRGDRLVRGIGLRPSESDQWGAGGRGRAGSDH
ncbi:phage/plasmid primase, P4 family [Rhodovarius lipocyclicus]|uniref:phage/plasmid primase, P4 family n=1 Tax=Rhodovarius lipocyclicus TaxID=268410 RepID=UPI001F16C213|nr:phage/plasmid primase, P4 family [Rhodovarius lipocyclicus]